MELDVVEARNVMVQASSNNSADAAARLKALQESSKTYDGEDDWDATDAPAATL